MFIVAFIHLFSSRGLPAAKNPFRFAFNLQYAQYPDKIQIFQCIEILYLWNRHQESHDIFTEINKFYYIHEKPHSFSAQFFLREPPRVLCIWAHGIKWSTLMVWSVYTSGYRFLKNSYFSICIVMPFTYHWIHQIYRIGINTGKRCIAEWQNSNSIRSSISKHSVTNYTHTPS